VEVLLKSGKNGAYNMFSLIFKLIMLRRGLFIQYWCNPDNSQFRYNDWRMERMEWSLESSSRSAKNETDL